MRKALLVSAVVAVLCGCAAQAQTPAPAPAAAPAAAPATAPAAAAIGPSRVMMLRVYVANIDRAVGFYRDVFGAALLQQMGGNVRIMTLPGGLPGIILIQSPEETTMNGSWVMQVQDLQATLARAAAHGGTLMNTHFEGGRGGMPAQAGPAQSSHIVDPDGNIIEILQMGAAPH